MQRRTFSLIGNFRKALSLKLLGLLAYAVC